MSAADVVRRRRQPSPLRTASVLFIPPKVAVRSLGRVEPRRWTWGRVEMSRNTLPIRTVVADVLLARPISLFRPCQRASGTAARRASRPLTVALGAVSLLFPFTSNAAAQDFMFSGTIDNFVSNQVFSLQTQNIRRAAARGDEEVTDGFFLPPADEGSALALPFAVDERARAREEAAYRRLVAKHDPGTARDLPNGIIAMVGEAIEPDGLSTDDLGDAMTLYVAQVWLAANAVSDDPSAKTLAALRRQIGTAFARLNESVPAEDGARQAEADRLFLQAYMIASLNMTTAQPGREAERAQVADAMGAVSTETFGVDFREVALDERGLYPEGAARMLAETADVPVPSAAPAPAASLGTPCGRVPTDVLEAKILRLFASRDACSAYGDGDYAAFKAAVPREQHYAINFLTWKAGKPLYPAGQARMMDGMIE